MNDPTVRYVIHEEDGQWWSESNGYPEHRNAAADSIYKLLRLIAEQHFNDWRRICPECGTDYSDWESPDNEGLAMQGGFSVCSDNCAVRRSMRLKAWAPVYGPDADTWHRVGANRTASATCMLEGHHEPHTWNAVFTINDGVTLVNRRHEWACLGDGDVFARTVRSSSVAQG